MQKLLLGLGAVVLISALLFVGAVFGGTVLWCIYPHIHSLFPTAASNGIIAQNLNWWDAVCVVWIFGLLIKSSHSSSNSKS